MFFQVVVGSVLDTSEVGCVERPISKKCSKVLSGLFSYFLDWVSLYRSVCVPWVVQCSRGTVQSWHVDSGVYSWVRPIDSFVCICGHHLQHTGFRHGVPHDARLYQGFAFWGWILHDAHTRIVCLRVLLNFVWCYCSHVILVPTFVKHEVCQCAEELVW